MFTPKARAGFREKLGFLSPDFLEKLDIPSVGAVHEPPNPQQKEPVGADPCVRSTPQQHEPVNVGAVHEPPNPQQHEPVIPSEARNPHVARIWLHAVSVGEFNAARTLIKGLFEKHYQIIISTTTATGNQLARTAFPNLPIFFFPFDFPWIVNRILDHLKPSVIVILETEIWPNLLAEASARDIPLIMANGRLSPKSFQGYLRFRWFFSWVLSHFSLLAMQSDEDAKRMLALGAPEERITAAGNIKFDMPELENSTVRAELCRLFKFPQDAAVLTFASSHNGEEELFIRMLNRLTPDFPNLKAIIAPRHPERFQTVANTLEGYGADFSLRSHLTPDNPDYQPSIILLDSIGELNAAFSLSTLACMGGSFIKWGGHNPLEPINARIPVIFGPSMENFRDIAEKVLQTGGGFQAKSVEEAEQHIRNLLTFPEKYNQTVDNGQRLMAQNRGATQILITKIEEYIRGKGIKSDKNKNPHSSPL